MPKDQGIGARSARREDKRFLTGTGRYTDDIDIHGQAHACFLRSEFAHGKIRLGRFVQGFANARSNSRFHRCRFRRVLAGCRAAGKLPTAMANR